METISKNIEDLLAFHTVAETGTFTQAALTLGTSKANVSKQVLRLESILKAQLFHRTTRSIHFTEEGEALFQYSQKIFELSNEAGRTLREMGRELSGVIRLATPVSFGEVFISDFLTSVSSLLPKVKFELDLSNENRDFSKDRLDFAIRADDQHSPDLIARYLGQMRDVICAAPAFLRKVPDGFLEEPRLLRKVNCIITSLEEKWNTWTLSSVTGEISVEVKGNYATNQYLASKRLCLAGLGVARLPYYVAQEELETGRLVRLHPDYQITTHPLYLVYQKSQYPSKRNQAVRDHILMWFKGHREIFI
ncbi:MAG: LysR family transcriptional regulator [Methylotenera sp.]|nr:LysR family transcriptional regulator [Oligoflexia bacterium]